MIAAIFADALKRAAERQLSVLELLATIDKLTTAGETALVTALYRTWTENNPSDPMLYAMYFNFGVVLSNANDLPGARHALSEAIRLNPEFLPPYINLGLVLERMGVTGDAVSQWYIVINKLGAIHGESVNHKITALKQLGRVLERVQYDVNAEEALRHCLELNIHQFDVIQHWISLRQRQCKWPVVQGWASVTREMLLNGISALSLQAHSDDPLMQLGNAYRYAKVSIGQPKLSFADQHQQRFQNKPDGPLKIGYLSSDLREHAIGFLTADTYGLHDRKKVEVYAYYCGHQVTDNIYTRIRAQVDHWIDISGMTDEQAAQRMFDDQIQILVDVNGYTHSARPKAIAMRPAPIIVNWLGFPGTLATPYHNYIVADEFIIPKGSEIYYSEKVLRLPCYQPNDRKRAIAERRPTRQEANLPEDGVVYCCFNGVHKITPFTWRRWMSILKQVPDSVLWLLDGIETVNQRLKDLMAAEGVSPQRLILAPKMRNQEHLARYPLADIFLDTSPYGAHTTSSDAMWMGVPIVTLAGRTFASRVCGSLATSAGLADLVCTTPEQYVALAVELGTNKAKLAHYRQKLAAGRDTCALFNTQLLVSSLEGLYAEMWNDFKTGKLPRPDLSNLDIYNDIGVELDNSDVELLTVKNYDDLYRQKLAALHNFSYLRGDGRLWPGDKTARIAP